MKTIKRYVCLLITLVMILDMFCLQQPVTAQAADTALPFTDVKKGTWKYNVAKFVYDRGIILGKTKTTFSPNTLMTRGQFMVILWRMNGKPAAAFKAPFSDVTKDYFGATAIQWAKDNGLASGYRNGSFGPNDPMTRAQYTAFMQNYARYENKDASTLGNYYTACPDANKVSDTFTTAVEWAFERGFIGANGKLAPNDNITRIQAAAILMRYINFYEETSKTAKDIFDVPYVSTYYFNPKPTISDTIEIPLYLTNHQQTEYLADDTTSTIDLIYEVDGVKKIKKGLPLGDYTLTLGTLPEGMHSFAVQVLDTNTGLASHKLCNDLWVIDPAKEKITEAQTYYMTTTDLAAYKIHNDNSQKPEDLISTRDGLTQLFADLQKKGYRKIVLLKGIYRINGDGARDNCINIPTHFTVDMNQSTFKLNTVTSENASGLVRFYETIDSHLTNGTLEGDRMERQALGLENGYKGEAITTLQVRGGKYSSVSNLTIKNTTGHTLTTNFVGGPNLYLSNFTNTVIKGGKEIRDDSCRTSSMTDLTKIIDWAPNERYLYVGHPEGYRGIKGNSAIVYVHFYDENQQYLESVPGYQFRKLKIVDGAKYARVTLSGTYFPTTAEDYPNTISIYAKHYGDYYSIHDLDFYDTRTTALAVASGNNWLIEDCTYTRCGCSITACAVDLEDGSEECQDIYYRNNTVRENAVSTTATVIDNYGFNHVMESCINHSIEVRNRVCGAVIRNMSDENTKLIKWVLGERQYARFGRVYNNTLAAVLFETKDYITDPVEMRVKDCKITSGWVSSLPDKVTFENCTLTNLSGNNARFRHCIIQPAGSLAQNLYFHDCTFQALDGSTGRLLLNFNTFPQAVRLFENCHFKGAFGTNGTFSSGVFRGCTFDDFTMIASVHNRPAKESILFENCTLNSTTPNFMDIGPFSYNIGQVDVTLRDCVIHHTGNRLIGLTALTTGDSRVLFENCTIDKTSGVLVGGYNSYSLPSTTEKVSLDILFKNSGTNTGLTIDSKVNPAVIHIQYQ